MHIYAVCVCPIRKVWHHKFVYTIFFFEFFFCSPRWPRRSCRRIAAMARNKRCPTKVQICTPVIHSFNVMAECAPRYVCVHNWPPSVVLYCVCFISLLFYFSLYCSVLLFIHSFYNSIHRPSVRFSAEATTDI